MRVLNIHERILCAPADAVWQLVDSLSSDRDRLWPKRWPPMRLDRALGVGASGGHGPIGYEVQSYTPGVEVTFIFTAPRGFDGTHRFEVSPVDDRTSRLRHVLQVDARGPALLKWSLALRPMHDALLEDAFDRASDELGCAGERSRWSLYVRLLRKLLRRRRPAGSSQ